MKNEQYEVIRSEKITDNNICKYIEKQDSRESIHTVHFVRETNIKRCSDKTSMYKLELVLAGEAYIHIRELTVKLVKGDIFVLFPNVPYVIDAITGDFEYMYISYSGVRAGEIMDRLKISGNNFLLHDYDELIPIWETAINLKKTVSDLISEGILLLTFAVIGDRVLDDLRKRRKGRNPVQQIKQYIDDNFSDGTLSLDRISDELFYNKKYLSYIFKKKMKMGFSDYLNMIRIQHACTLIEQGMTSVKDISAMCGYRDPLYFSKIFKQKMGDSPTEHIAKNDERL